MKTKFRLHEGDCIAVLKTLPDSSVDSCVTDPPYGLEFMGKEWDAPWKQMGSVVDDPSSVGGFQDGNGGNPYSRSRIRYGRGHGFQDWCEVWAREVLRVLKPGGHLLAFGGTRTYHRMVCAIEDAGFEIRDQIGWLYGSGFPKSLDVSKAIDKKAGAKREVRRFDLADGGVTPVARNGKCNDCGKWRFSPDPCRCPRDSGPSTLNAQRWSGWGTALKPAWEPIVVARKPLVGTVAENVTKFGTGAINVDGCRVECGGRNDPNWRRAGRADDAGMGYHGGGSRRLTPETLAQGRWPANIIHDGSEEVLEHFPWQKTNATGSKKTMKPSNGYMGGWGPRMPFTHDKEGSAARFFYCAKASKRDRDEGCEEFDQKVPGRFAGTGGQETPHKNSHPTVKPTALMRYLCRLVTQPGGTVLDPFTGSGSTGKAALLEGFRFIGIEREKEYCAIARARINPSRCVEMSAATRR